MQFDETGQTQWGDAQVVQITVDRLPTAQSSSLAFTLLSDLNVSGEGVPVFAEGRLAGLLMSYESRTRMGDMVPYPVLRRFLAGVRRAPYRGFAYAGFAWAPLPDPVKRAYLGVAGEEGGVLVLHCLPGSGAGAALRPLDVLLAWDGHPVDNLGFYADPEFGRLNMAYLVKGRREPGDSIAVTVVREKVRRELTLRLDRRSDELAMVPENETGEPADYLIEGGIILQELTGRYLRSHGPGWEQSVDSRLVDLYVTRRDAPDVAGRRVVFISGILPDPVNAGYERFRHVPVATVNGEAILNILDVFRIAERDGFVERIGLQSVGLELALPRDELGAANRRLAAQYRIPRLRCRRAPAPGQAHDP